MLQMQVDQQIIQKKQVNRFQVITIVLLVIILVSIIQVGRTIVEIEELKVGGAENRAKLGKLMSSDEYKEQYAQSIDLMLEEIESGNTAGSSQFEDTINSSDKEDIIMDTTGITETDSSETVSIDNDSLTGQITTDTTGSTSQ